MSGVLYSFEKYFELSKKRLFLHSSSPTTENDGNGKFNGEQNFVDANDFFKMNNVDAITFM